MTLKAQLVQEGESVDWVADAAYSGGDVVQLKDGRAGVVSVDVASGATVGVYVCGIFKLQKTTSIVMLNGGRVAWDYSASKAHFKTVNDQDFFFGSAVEDATSAATTIKAAINVHPTYVCDLSRDAFASVIVGTAAAGAFGFPRRFGGANTFALTATSEAQKVDALGTDGFANGANAIVEMRLNNVSNGTGGTQDWNIGLANATHATDADSITRHLFCHIDGNSTNINFQSKDGTTTVAATDSTVDLTAGTAFEVWFDMRNPASVLIYVDGVAVLTSTTFDVSAMSTTWFLLAHLEKTTGTDTFEGRVDWLKARLSTI